MARGSKRASRNRKPIQETERPMPDHKPTPQPEPHKEQCAVQLHGYVECCCPEPVRMCNKFFHLPCNVEGEDIIAKLTQLTNANVGYNVTQVLDHGHDGWTVIMTGPCC